MRNNIVYIKDYKTFVTKWSGDSLGYTGLPIFSDDNATGNIVIPQKDVNIYKNDIVLMDGNAWVVESAEPDEEQNVTALTVKDVLNLFNYMYPDNHKGHASAEEYLSAIIINHYKGNVDPVYAKTYLTSTVSTSGTKCRPIEPEKSEETIFKEDDYFRKCGTESEGVRYSVSYTNSSLAIDIKRRDNTPKILCIGDGHHILRSRDFNKDIVSKISVAINGQFTPSGASAPTKYTDGSTAYPIHYVMDTTGKMYRYDKFPSSSTRAEGKWVVREVSVDAAPYDKTKTYSAGAFVSLKSGNNYYVYRANFDVPVRSNLDNFYTDFQRYAEWIAYNEESKNVYTYKVELDSDILYNWQDRVKIRFEDGMIFTGIITSITMDRDNDMYHYRIGNLPNTVTEKLKKQISENKTSLSVTNKTEVYNSGSSESISYSEIQGILGQ